MAALPKQPAPGPIPLLPGVHYYIESGCWVFTRLYLRERGFCCGSGCRHCPYKPADPASAIAQNDEQSKS